MIQITNKDVENYIEKKIRLNSTKLEELRILSEKNAIPIIHRDVENFLKFIIKSHDVKNILEIGTAVAYSALMFSENMHNGKITTIERYEKMYIEAKNNIKLFDKENQINLCYGDASDVLNDLDEKFDLVFIDAAKSHYREYFDKSIKLLNFGGLIISDNVLFSGRVVDDIYVERRNRTITRNMRKYLDYISNPPYYSSILPIGDGLSITIIEN